MLVNQRFVCSSPKPSNALLELCFVESNQLWAIQSHANQTLFIFFNSRDLWRRKSVLRLIPNHIAFIALNSRSKVGEVIINQSSHQIEWKNFATIVYCATKPFFLGNSNSELSFAINQVWWMKGRDGVVQYVCFLTADSWSTRTRSHHTLH